MADCRKCLYQPVCKKKTDAVIHSIAYGTEIDIDCGNFKDKANFVEAVRCSECEYGKRGTINDKGFKICPASGMEITETDFCSYGERKG